jgi:hypothetical protein
MIERMFEEDEDDTNENFEETLRSIAHELGESVHRTMSQFDVDEIADAIGVDADRAREWVDTAATWLSRRVENFGEEFSVPEAWRRGAQSVPDAWRRGTAASTDPLRGAAPHPLDVPTEEQGLALAALESGRWTVEPGTETLAAHGEGPGPSDALGLVRELRARDWIAADGKLTTVGRRALDRWVGGATKR